MLKIAASGVEAGAHKGIVSQQLLSESGNITLQVGPAANDYDKLTIKLPSLQDALSMLDNFRLETQAQAQQSLDKVERILDLLKTGT